MSVLAALMKKRNRELATATPATFATQEAGKVRTVATVATVAVANPENRKTALAPSTWWRIQFTVGKRVEVACYPPATREEVLAGRPGAIDAEAFTTAVKRPAEPLSQGDEAAIRRWLADIGETDGEVIAEVFELCQRDADARRYFVEMAGGEQ
jgi:hypothetical protein